MPVRILLVEDNATTRELIREYLKRDPELEVVTETSSGSEAVRLAEQHQPDIVLMDLALEGMDGLKASQAIARACPGTHIIILTNYAFDELKDRARDMYGASAFLSKEAMATKLLPTIHSLKKDRNRPA